MKKQRNYFTNDPIKFLCIIISIAFTIILYLSLLKLHSIPLPTHHSKINSSSNGIGRLGEMVIQMLPQDLSFTLFLPSDKSFSRDLGLLPNDLLGEKMNDTYVILTRVLGFCAVPRSIKLVDLVGNEELNYDSISGYILYISKDFDNLIVNGIVSEMVDLRRSGRIVVHVMDGVIMDSEFEQSVRPSNDEDDD